MTRSRRLSSSMAMSRTLDGGDALDVGVDEVGQAIAGTSRVRGRRARPTRETRRSRRRARASASLAVPRATSASLSDQSSGERSSKVRGRGDALVVDEVARGDQNVADEDAFFGHDSNLG